MISDLDKCLIRPGGSLRDALKALNEGGLEIVLVTDGARRLQGILTDGDVRRALIGGAGIQDPLGPYIQRIFVSVGPQEERGAVLDLMQAKRIHEIPIIGADGTLLGLHTLHEILGAAVKPNWAVFMAGGRGERLRPITDLVPKPMIRVAGRPILERLVLHFVGHGIRRVFFAVHFKADLIESHFGAGDRFGCDIRYLKESSPLGTGGALSLLPEKPSHPLLVCNGDLLTQVNVSRLLEFHVQGGFRATVAYNDFSFNLPYGVLEIEGNRLKRMREKPTETWKTNAGIYVLDPALVERVPPETFLPLPSLLEDCLNRGEAVGSFPVEEEWMDVGDAGALRIARGEVRDK